ncbi:MAG: MerR family transcriptional regulator [Bacteroidota bacterium]|nr:MerR family transcriptional regulator [Bacteroidota bacterium]
MQYFSIKDIENLSGIKAHTLRIWEQRYQFISPQRHPSQHRSYTNEDLKYILKISFLYHNGYKISKLTQLQEEELIQLVQKQIIQPEQYILFINRLIEASIDFDEEQFENVFNQAVNHLGFEHSIFNVTYPFLQTIGLLWMTNSVIPGQEHFASNIIRKKILSAINAEGGRFNENRKMTTLLFCPENEKHELPLLMHHYLFKKYRKNVIYLGPDMHVNEIKEYTEKFSVTHLQFHLITNLTNQSPEDLIEEYLSAFPQQKIVITGPFTKTLSLQSARVLLLDSLESLTEHITSLS